MTYSEFERLLLVAAARLSDELGKEVISAREVFDRYDIPRKPNWLRRAITAFIQRGWAINTLKQGPEDNLSICLKSQGYIEAENLSAGLDLREKNPSHDTETEPQGVEEALIDVELESISKKLAIAANRLVSLKGNQPARETIVRELNELCEAFKSSNLIEPSEKADVVVSLNAAKDVVKHSDTWFAGVMKYLVFDRVKQAVQGVIEDAIKNTIRASIATLATIILALI